MRTGRSRTTPRKHRRSAPGAEHRLESQTELLPIREPNGDIRQPAIRGSVSWHCGHVTKSAGRAVGLNEVADSVRRSVARSSRSAVATAVDGPGGAGKSTFAARLSDALGGVPIVHTDDFASWDDPIDWWPRLIEQVLEPLSTGATAQFQPYNWVTRSLDSWVEIDAPQIIIEGVGANRLAFSPFVSFAIWIETSRGVRLARGLERDGAEMHEQWNAWMAAEDDYVARESPAARSDLVISGESSLSAGDDNVVILSSRRRAG